ncbi:hemoglobinase-like [Tetranychus urticae]|uniref:Uncharacterized protein n=1 Tax=Tetranychus urticae TaxID=32264 RepID=T1KC10_TETUR|nr:hemoglobinase-like [Tetranychus urticae]
MKSSLIYLALVLCFGQVSLRVLIDSFSDKSSQIHAVLVGGGAGVATDYNDQANICHAYHVLINHGVLPENIVLMIYDDVAYAPENPFPGKLFNQPNGTDVYAGCIKDYTGNDVNPETFMKVLKGDKELA